MKKVFIVSRILISESDNWESSAIIAVKSNYKSAKAIVDEEYKQHAKAQEENMSLLYVTINLTITEHEVTD